MLNFDSDQKEKIRNILHKLSYREREFIKLRLGIEHGSSYTLDEVRRIFKISISKAQSIESKTLKKIERLIS